MLTKLVIYTAVSTLSTASLITATHYSSHAYIDLESKVNTYIQLKTDQLRTLRMAYNNEKPLTLPITIPLNEIIERESKLTGLNPKLVEALIEIESNGKTDAERFEPLLNTRSIGLTQVLASNAGHGACKDISWTELYQAEPNIKCGTAMLAENLRSKKSLFAALIAFNGGPTCETRPACKEKASGYAGKVIMRFAEKVKRS